MKRTLAFILVACTLILHTRPVSASEVYSFEDLKKIHDEQSTLVKEIELQHELDQHTYEEVLDQYKDLEETVQNLQDQMTVLQIQIDQTIQSAQEAKRSDTVRVPVPPELLPPGVPPTDMEVDAKEYYMDMKLPGLVNGLGMVKNIYEDVVKGQLAAYEQMELLKFQLEYIEIDKKQKLMKEDYDFQELCYEYYLLSMEGELLQQKKELLEEKKNIIEKQYDLGQITLTESQAIDQELYGLKKEQTVHNQNINRTYHTLLKILNLNSENAPKLDIQLEEPEVYEPLESITFNGVVNNQSITMKILERQNSIYDEQLTLAGTAYDEDEDLFNKIYLDTKRNKINNNRTKQQMTMLVDQIHHNYALAVKQFNVAKRAYEITKEEYNLATKRNELGQLSQYEYQEAIYNYKQEVYNYEKAKIEYRKAGFTYEEALAGIIESR